MGAGEVARYLGTYGSDRVAQGGVPGLPGAVPAQDARQPRGACTRACSTASEGRHRATGTPTSPGFYNDFYNLDENLGKRISEEAVPTAGTWPRVPHRIASGCVPTWITDFRDDIAKIDVPTLIVHGTARPHPADRRDGPAGSTSCCKAADYVEIEGAPHGCLTHADEVNQALLEFVGAAATGGGLTTPVRTPHHFS